MSIKKILPLMMALGKSPGFTSGPVVTHWSYDSFNITGSTNMSCTIYVYALADGSAVPNRATIKASGTSLSATAYFSIALSSLTESTAYDVYVLAESTTGGYTSIIKLDVTTAPNLNTTLGANLIFWMNGRARTNKTLTGLWNEIPSAFTSSETTGALTFSNISATSSTTKYNGKGCYFLNAGMAGPVNKSKLNSVHNGNAFTIVARIFVTETDTTTVQTIISNNNNSTAKTGFTLAYDNRTSTSSTHKLLFMLSKSSGGNTVFNLGVNNFFALRTWTTVTIKYDGVSTLTYYKDGVSQGTVSPTNTPFVATDASDDISIGKLSVSATYSTVLVVSDIVVTDTALSDGNRGTVESTLSAQVTALGSSGKANIYFMGGQSNMAGYPTSPSAYLTGTMKTFIWSLTDDTGLVSSNQFPRALLMGTSQNTEDTARFGPELEFGYRMSLLVPNVTFLSKYAVSATTISTATNPDWNVATGGTDCALMSRAQLGHMYRYCRFVLDRDIDVRGWVWSLGETDAIAGNASYKTDLSNLLKYHIDYLVTTYGYSPSKMRVNVSLIDQAFTGTARPFASAIVTSQIAFVTDFPTDEPTYYGAKLKALTHHSKADLVLDDGTHLTMASMITEGNRDYQYYAPYASET